MTATANELQLRRLYLNVPCVAVPIRTAGDFVGRSARESKNYFQETVDQLAQRDDG